jgi:hypothetical protein
MGFHASLFQQECHHFVSRRRREGVMLSVVGLNQNRHHLEQ